MYLSLFTMQGVAGEAVIIWYEIDRITTDDPYATMIAIFQGIGLVAAASVMSSYTITEVINNIMLTSEWIRQKLVEPAKEKNRLIREKNRREEERVRREEEKAWREEWVSEGRAEVRDLWIAWNERRLQAEAKGEKFDEPIPDFENGLASEANPQK